MAPIPEAIFLVNLSVWLLQLSLSSLSTPSDLVVVTCPIGAPLIVGVGESVRVLSLCLDPISIISVLVMFRVSLFTHRQPRRVVCGVHLKIEKGENICSSTK